jgi:putative membrane protein
MRILGAIVGNAIALLATTVVPGITFTGSLLQLLIGGAIFGLFNLIVRPIALFLSLPAMVLTLGLFYFVMNGILLWLAGKVIPGYHVGTIVAGVLGSLVVAVVNWALGILFRAPAKEA